MRAVPDEGLTWRVCEDYEIRRLSENIESAYLRAKYPKHQNTKWMEYKPLQESPNLFLRFAKLHERELSEKLALDWARKYGLLGYVPDQETMLQKSRAGGVSWEELRRVPRPKQVPEVSGIPSDGTVGVFWEEVRRAAGVLMMYEAALHGDNEVAKGVIREGAPFIGGRIWPSVAHGLPMSANLKRGLWRIG